MVWEDPIVAETRALRQQLMDEVGNDLDRLVKYLQERELEHPERLVSLEPRRPELMAATPKLEAVLAKVPDVEPDAKDRIAPRAAKRRR